MDDGRVAQAAQFQHLIGIVKALLRVFHFEIGQHGAELFFGQGVVVIRLIQRRNQNLRLGGHLQPGLLGNPVCAFAHQRCIHALVRVREHIFRKLLGLFLVEEVAVVGLHIVLEIFCDGFVHNHSLLRRTNHAVVECFRHHQVCAGAVQIGRFLNIAGHVARAYAQRGLAAGISRLHHARAARGQNGGHARVVHQGAGGLNGGLVNPLDAVFWRAGLYSRLVYNAGRLGRAFLRRGVEAENDGVARFHRNQAFEQRGGGGVRGGRHAANYTHGLCNFHIAFHFIFVQNAHGFFVLDVVPDIFRGKHILDYFVFIYAAARFLHGHARQFLVLIQARQGHFMHNKVHLLLVQLQKLLQGHLRLFHQRINHGVHFRFHRGDGRCFLFCHSVFLQNQIL